MSPARWPRPGSAERILVLDTGRGVTTERGMVDLPSLLQPGDLVVVNDAATLPASLSGTTSRGASVEIRFTGRRADATFEAVLLGAGDWRTPTETRPLPPRLEPGEVLTLGATDPLLRAHVVARSSRSARLLDLRFDGDPETLWPRLYRAGQPVQYAYMSGALELWHVQTPYASRPWAVEMPSAGRPLSVSALAALRRRGIELAWLTHAAGLSSTGDHHLDRELPLPERYDLPERTVRLVGEARARDRAVLAIGTSVVRALEGNYETHGRLVAGEGETTLRIGAGFEPRIVTGLLSGVHSPGESHYDLLKAFVSPELLSAAHERAVALDMRDHEFGDKMFIAARALRASHSRAA